MLEGAMEGGKRAFVGELHQSRGRCGWSLEMEIIILMRARMSMVTVLKKVALTLRLRGSKTRCRRKMKKVDVTKSGAGFSFGLPLPGFFSTGLKSLGNKGSGQDPIFQIFQTYPL